MCRRRKGADSTMSNQHTNSDFDQRRAGIRRTAWIVGGIAFAIFVLFFLEQGVLR
jgi:type VI protein secretion system component VasF